MIIRDGAPNIRVGVAVAPIAASSPLSSAGQRSAASADFALLINFTIRVGLRAAAALGIGITKEKSRRDPRLRLSVGLPIRDRGDWSRRVHPAEA